MTFIFESDQRQKRKILYQYLLFFIFKKAITLYRKNKKYKFLFFVDSYDLFLRDLKVL
jgi:hypothetical protein